MPDEQLIDAVGQLVADHKWVAVASAVIGLLVRLSKRDIAWLPSIDARWRALLAVVLGVASGVLDKVANGTPWRAALLGGLFSGMLAISSHDVIIEGFRRGKEIVKPPGETPPGTGGDGKGTIVPPVRESRRAPPMPLYPERAVGDAQEIDITDEGLRSAPSKVASILLVPALLALAGCASKDAAYGERAASCELAVDKAFREIVGRERCADREAAIVASGACKKGFSLGCPVVILP